jgi:hypothetical protein
MLVHPLRKLDLCTHQALKWRRVRARCDCFVAACIRLRGEADKGDEFDHLSAATSIAIGSHIGAKATATVKIATHIANTYPASPTANARQP